MKKTLTVLVLAILLSSSELLSQSSWIDKGEYLQMENTPAAIRHMKLSSDESKLLLISDTSYQDEIAEYIEIDMASGEEVFKKQINYPRTYSLPSCLLPDRRFIYQSDSLTVTGMNLTTGENYFSIVLEPVKEFGDSLVGFSQITGIYPWHDNELFCVTIETKYKPVNRPKYMDERGLNFGYGVTGNYYFLNRNGVVKHSSETTGSITKFIAGKDIDNYAIETRSINFREIETSVIEIITTKLFGEHSKEIESKYKLLSYNIDMDVMITSSAENIQFIDMTTKETIGELSFNTRYRKYFGISKFLLLQGSSYDDYKTKLFDFESMTTIRENLFAESGIKSISIIENGEDFIVVLAYGELYLFKPFFMNDTLSASYYINEYHILEESVMTFNSSSLGYPDSWLWDFGDGTTSNDKQPVHVFKEPGECTVSLTVYKGGDSSMYISGHPVIVHKVLNPIISVSPLAGIPPFEISVENMTEDAAYYSYIRVGDEPNWYEQEQVLDTITGSGDIYVWLTLYDSVFKFVDYEIVKSEHTVLESEIFTLDRIFPEEFFSSTIETIVLGNYDNLIFSCRYYEFDDDLILTNTYYTINSIDKDFTNFKTIKLFEDEIDLVKLINGNYLILYKQEGKSTLEIDENGNEISQDRYTLSTDRIIKSIKRGSTGNVYLENRSFKSQYITCFNQNAEEIWEIETKKLVSYLPLKSGGLAIAYNDYIFFDVFTTGPVGTIEIYNSDGIIISKYVLEAEYYPWENLRSHCYPYLLHESIDNSVIFRHTSQGNIQPDIDRMLSTSGYGINVATHPNSDIYFINDELWFCEMNGLHLYNSHGTVLISDKDTEADFKSAVFDNDIVFFAGQKRSSSIPSSITFKTDAYLAKTKKISTLTSVTEAPAATAPGLQISPNPSSDKLKVSINLNSADWVNLEILDINGNHINSVFHGYLSPGQQEISADLSDYPVGAYIIRLIAGRNVYSSKLIVKR